ncbi:oligosaccharide repeat unit polymerase [Arsenicicoccus sp. oral taxon 190]|uniref:oligosaccharide repeat unit polymerase n=1 Tax=Arsenicicoccus sp. oral taxon 190 TaxID=1658671 RepID=UPI0012E1D469|nr:oligosaccharide repeat unit polymerase [Arsenicicoccus sp. oral taxon 190]
MAALLCAVVPALLIGATQSPLRAEIPWAAVGVMLIAGARYAWIVASASRHLYEMVLWLFTYVFMGCAPFVQQRLGDEIGTTPRLDPHYFSTAWGVVFVGILGALAGSAVGRKIPLSARTTLPDVSHHRTIALSAFAFIMSIVYVWKVGPGSLFLNRYAFGAVQEQAFPNTVVGALIGGWASMGMLVALIAQLQIYRLSRGHDRRRWLVLAWITGVALAYLNNPLSSPRFMVGTVVLGVLAAVGGYATQRRFRAVAVAALAGLIVVFPLLNTFRGSTPGGDSGSAVGALQSGDFDAFAQIVNTVDLVAHEGVSFGRQLAGVLLFWVPRTAWPDKPFDTGILLAQYKSYGFKNLSAPLWSEFYVNFGIAGVLVGFFLVGLLARVLDRRHHLELLHQSAPSLAGCVFPFYSLLLIRGSLLQAVSIFAVAAVAIWSVSARSPRGPATTRPRPVEGTRRRRHA